MENIRDLQCGKMSQEHSPQMAEKTSDAFLKNFCKIKDTDLSVPKPEKWTKGRRNHG